MSRSSPIDLSLCSWNANGLLKRRIELRIFIKKHSPDIILIQETHLRPSHSFNIANYHCYRNDRISEDRAPRLPSNRKSAPQLYSASHSPAHSTQKQTSQTIPQNFKSCTQDRTQSRTTTC
ncbi:hypothetical protein TNCV_4080221 [Trichonephila clavipes]|nr:hypothetical protein TNCV_4080221 [Trichonephila clavipes]